jgi:predicted O-linked N-acetylglucosamine transferase (SPINDLY family)
MDALRPAPAAATVSLRAASTSGAEAHGVQRPAVQRGEVQGQAIAQARSHDHPPLSATALRLALPTLLLARQAFDLNRRDTAACVRTAELLLAQHHPTEVLDCLDLLDASVARGAAWHLARASALSALRDDRQAVRDAKAAVAKAGPNAALHQRALLQLGQGLTRLQEHAEAAWCHQMALDAQPQAADAALAAAFGRAADLDWEALPDHLDRLLAGMAQSPAAAQLPLAVPLDPSQLIPLLDNPLLQRWLATLACQQRHGTGAAHEKPKPGARDHRRQGKWRLGILAGGRERSEAALEPSVAALFDAFDRAQVELYVYSDARSGHPLALAAAHWHDSRHASTDDLVSVIRGDRIDLLLDLTGPGDDSRLGVLAQRPAPVQVAWLGHAGTTGAPWVDYLIGDPVVTPLDAQAQFSECIAQLPGCHRPADLPPQAPPPSAPPRRADCGLPDTAPVLASFNPPERITAAQFRAWCQILSAVPGAVLWLLTPAADARRRMRASLARAGLDPARLVFAPKVAPQDHLARLPLADLVLDCFPGNAETAARDALGTGVPVLTRIGQGFAARRTASLLAAFRLPALVCADADHYVRTAVHLLRDADAMAQLKTRLANVRSQAPHLDAARSARDLEHLLARMVARHDAGLPPTPLAAEPAPRRD